jgi:hypothetical protein
MLATGVHVTAEAQDPYARERGRMLDEIAVLTRETRLESGRAALAERVMAAMAKVPRHEFVPADQKRNRQGAGGRDRLGLPGRGARRGGRRRLYH